MGKRKAESPTVIAKRIKSNWTAGKPAMRRFVPKGSSKAELKAVDLYQTGTLNQASSGTVTLLNPIGTGTDFYQRVGRKVKLSSILFKGHVALQSPGTGASGSSESYPIRVALVYDDQPNGGSTPVVSDIFQSVDSSGSAASASPYTPLNLNNRDRFTVLKDWTMCLKPITNLGTTGSYGDGMHAVRNLSFYKRLNLDAIFNGTGAGLSTIQTGALYFVAYQLQVQAANGICGAYNFVSRVRYTDN